jgi:hypothetical protein
MNLTELEQLAKDVVETGSDAGWDEAANPETILRLIELVKEMGECMPHCYAETDARISERAAILAKYKEWMK